MKRDDHAINAEISESGTATDVSHALSRHVKHLSHEVFRSGNDFFDTLLNAVPVPVFYKDTDGRYLGCNKAFEEFFGVSKEKLLGKSVFDISPRELAEKYHAKDQELLRNNGQQIYESQVINVSGSVRDVVFHKASFSDSTGTVCGLVGAILDITERNLAEKTLKESEARLRESQLIAGLGTYVLDIETGEWVSSEVLDLIFGIDDSFNRTVAGWVSLLHPDDRDQMVTYFAEEVLGKRGRFDREYRIVRNNDGEVRWLSGLGRLECEGQGGIPLRMIGTVQDITERKAVEKELRLAKEAADAANRAKSRFLSNMRHEIRTPMNSVLVMADLLLNSGLNGEQREHAEIVKKSGNHLLSLIDDILDLSHIEAQTMELDSVNFDLSEMLSRATMLMSYNAREKGLQFNVQVDDDVPRKLRGDERRVRQIISNLLGNALKFTHGGGISLCVSRENEEGPFVTLRIVVSDTGIGIAADKQMEVFSPFNQVDSSSTRRYGGTGLGLALCRQLAELMKGEIGLESCEGKGSSFWFTVRMERQNIPPAPVACLASDTSFMESSGQADRRLLLVEDDLQNQKILLSTIRMFRPRFLVDVAANGCEALHMLERNDYDLVLMDCMLPVLNGYDATAAIRDPASAVRNHQVTVIAVTANSMREDREACLAAGMDDYISKPLNITQLLAMLDKWLTR